MEDNLLFAKMARYYSHGFGQSPSKLQV